MASFSLVLTIPASTTKIQDVKTETYRAPASGKITSLTFHFPLGNYAKTPMALRIEDRQVFPVIGKWIRGNDSTETLETDILVFKNQEITLVGLNEDTDSHTVRCFGIIKEGLSAPT